jgi:hypothetical protein
MFLPPRVCTSTDGWKRRPSHSSQGDSTVAMTPSSVMTTPTPPQVVHAPSEFELNSAGLTPLAFANAFRTGSSRPVQVAGLLRREPFTGDWSTTTTPSCAAIDPCTRELLPEPATPVTAQSTPRGTSTSTSRRLWLDAPRTSSRPVGARTSSFRGTRSSRWRPVTVLLASSPATSPS